MDTSLTSTGKLVQESDRVLGATCPINDHDQDVHVQRNNTNNTAETLNGINVHVEDKDTNGSFILAIFLKRAIFKGLKRYILVINFYSY